MKRLLGSVLLITALVAGGDFAAAAVKASYGGSNAILTTSTGSVALSGASGIGLANKGGKGGATPTPIDVRFPVEPQGEGMNRALAYLSGKGSTVDTTLQIADLNQQVQQVIALGPTSVLELELPGVDATDAKRPLEFRLRLQPTQLSVQPGSGKVAVSASKAAKLSAANFRVSLDGVAQTYVTRVSPTVVRRSGKEVQVSGFDVALPLAQGLAGDWWKWVQTGGAGRTLKIEYLDPALKAVLLTVDYTGVGIESVEFSDLASGSDKITQISYQLSADGVVVK